MTIILIIAILIGLLQAYISVSNAKNGIGETVSPSSNMIDFIFLNK